MREFLRSFPPPPKKKKKSPLTEPGHRREGDDIGGEAPGP